MPELSPERIAELKRLAKAATPGKWIARLGIKWAWVEAPSGWVADCMPPRGSLVPTEGREANAAHIAACDPPTILVLIAMMEAAKAATIERCAQIAEQVDVRDDEGYVIPLTRMKYGDGYEIAKAIRALSPTGDT